jgi:pimeloyl-ACP methyl ester carboxylesterase
MAKFILVHGACHGAWCWTYVIPALEARGHSVLAIDMPGRGGGVDGLTLSDQAEAILSAYDGEAVLVGHSAGGLSISAAAQAAPERVSRLIYVAALIPENGDSVGGLMGALTGERAKISFLRAEDGLSYSFDTTSAGPALYNGAAKDRIDWALGHVAYEPSAPPREAIALGANFANTPKSAVICTQDRVIPGVDQQRMAKGIHDMAQIDTGHSPFLSTPDILADHLDHMGA